MTLSLFMSKRLIVLTGEELDPNVSDIFIYPHLAKVLESGHLFISQLCTEFHVPGANLISNSVTVPCNKVLPPFGFLKLGEG